MTAITFDTFKFVRRLKESGIPENQAEAISEALQEAQEFRLAELADKRDLKELDQSVKRDLMELENRLVKWVATMFIAQSALVIGAMFALFRIFSGN